ncbi:MAG: HD-GYP domain-containing protein, partial [Firmicutes bacterium]|nr:HD-GYP domain-containing protein [Bacillota bacterium]
LLVNIIDLKSYDDYTYSHSVNVTILSLSIGAVIGLSKNILFKLGMAALLHDIGKVFIPKEILNKNGRLNESEFEIVKTHPYKGYQILKENNSFSYYSSIGVLHHHEKYNGTGYPFELVGSEISLLGRIITVADVYDALTSDRPYRKAMFPSEAIEYIMGGGGTLFDSEIVKFFTKIVVPYPVGTSVLLSNNTTGIVVKNYSDCCMRPIIKVVKHGDTLVTPYYIDLKNDPNTRGIVISGIVDM